MQHLTLLPTNPDRWNFIDADDSGGGGSAAAEAEQEGDSSSEPEETNAPPLQMAEA